MAEAKAATNGIGKEETAKEAGKFGIVGVINTIIDLGIFNVLIFVFNVNPVTSNVIAVSSAILNSFIWNKKWTFHNADKKHMARQAFLFVFFSVIGMILNTLVLKLLTESWTAPGNFAVSIVNFVGLDSIFSDEFVFVNFAKAWGLGVSMVWNFITYKKVVFKK